MWRALASSRVCCSVLLVGCAALLATTGPARASSTFAFVLLDSSQSTVQVAPGDVFALNVVVTGLAASTALRRRHATDGG
jgi:hypothetical protein